MRDKRARIGDIVTQLDGAMRRSSTVVSVERATILLEHLARTKSQAGVRELARALGLSRSTVQRLLRTLKGRGFVMQHRETRKYSLGMKAVEVGLAALARVEVVDVARPYLEHLAESSAETVNLAVENSGEVIYLYKVEGPKTVRTNPTLGSRLPMHCTALGKVMLADLLPKEVDEILAARGMPKLTEKTNTDRRALHRELSLVRKTGFATDYEETEEDLCCVAAPIRNHNGEVIAAISVSPPASRMAGTEAKLVQMVKDTASDISARIGFIPTATCAY